MKEEEEKLPFEDAPASEAFVEGSNEPMDLPGEEASPADDDPWLEKEDLSANGPDGEEQSADELPTTGLPPMDVVAQSPLPDTEEYKQGFWIGYLRLDRRNYEGWFAEQTHIAALEKEQQALEQRLQSLQQLLPETKAACLQLQNEINAIKHRLDYEQKQFERRKQEYDRVCEEENSYLEERAGLRHKYSLLAGILFFVAGFVFIAGDLIISHEIVAYALNIKNNIEAWSFAVGLAMVSVLLKPAYDRLIEIPYNQSKSRRAKAIYVVFKMLMVGFTIATLLVLGFFRYEAYKTDRLKQSLAQRILQLQASDELSGQQLQELESLSAQAGALDNQLVGSRMGLLSFVLSGVLFAVAGAVCLGISFPVLVAYTRLWFQIPWRLKKLQKIKQEKQAVVEQLEQTVSQTRSQLDALQQQLQMTERPEQLIREIKDIEGRLALIEEELHRHRLEERIYRLNHGYEQGQVSLQHEQARVRQQVEHLHHRIAELEEKLNQREEHLQQSREQLRRWEEKQREWQAADEQRHEQMKALEARMLGLESTLHILEEEKEVLQASLQMREQQMTELKSRLKTTEQELRYARAAAEKAREEAAGLLARQEGDATPKTTKRRRKTQTQTNEQAEETPAPAAEEAPAKTAEKKTRKRRTTKTDTTAENAPENNKETN